MSDRTPGSVRTARGEDGGVSEGQREDVAPADTARVGAESRGQTPPVSATQSIPTGGMRAQGGPQTGASAPPAPMAPGAVPGGMPPRTVPPGRPGPQTGAAPAARPAAPGGRPARGRGRPAGRGPRRARLQLRHIDIWSAFKISLVLSIALFFIWMVAIGILYAVLNGLGVFRTVNDLFGQLGSATGGKGSGNIVRPGIVFGGAAVIGAINVILWTALGTVATFIYNMCADLVGGLEVTLSERD